MLTATGPKLLEPITFGPHAGKRLYQLKPEYYIELAQKARINHERLFNQARASAQLYRTRRSQITQKPILRQESTQTPTRHNVALPDGLYGHQKEFIERFYGAQCAGMFFDMGTGKTLTMVTILNLEFQSNEKVLIFCPKSVFSGWEKELSVNSKLSFITLTGPSQKKLMRLSAARNIYILNYEAILTENLYQAIVQKGFNWIICDESHKIKNHTSKTKADKPTIAARIRELGSVARKRYALTGTPVTNSEKDVWSQAYFLDRGKTFGPSFSKFYKEWFSRGVFSYYSGEFKNDREALFKRKLQSISMRVRKEDAIDLPEQTFVIRDIELTGTALKTYTEMMNNALTVLKDKEINAQNKISEILRLRQICGGGINDDRFNSDKLKELSEVLDELSNPPVIVCTFRHELDDIANLLRKRKMTFGRIDGGRSQQDRDDDIQAFSQGQLDAFIMQIEAGGVGVNGLQNHSSTMIFYSNTFKWDSRKQCESRIHRSGQKWPCTYIDFLTWIPGKETRRPTVEHAVMKRLQDKNTNIQRLIDDIIKDIEHDEL